jgi:hypothetical protein
MRTGGSQTGCPNGGYVNGAYTAHSPIDAETGAVVLAHRMLDGRVGDCPVVKVRYRIRNTFRNMFQCWDGGQQAR